MRSTTPTAGFRLALSWLSVLPVRGPGEVGRPVAAAAITLAPVVGAVLGGAAVTLGWAALQAGTGAAVAGVLTVGLLVLGSRGMHVDGLADVADGLGSYAPAERALQIMKQGTVGPFGAVALVLVLGLQAATIAQLLTQGRGLGVVLAAAAGRACFGWCCRRGVPAARNGGLGALVADTQALWWPAGWTVALLALGVWWHWPAAIGVLVATLLAVLLARHAVRRLGGITGDVLGAVSELGTTAVLLTATLA